MKGIGDEVGECRCGCARSDGSGDIGAGKEGCYLEHKLGDGIGLSSLTYKSRTHNRCLLMSMIWI